MWWNVKFIFNRVFLSVNMNEKICRLCFQTISDDKCQTVEEFLLKYLKLNRNISEENVMCIECASCLRVFTNFRSGSLYMGNEMLPLSDLKNGVKLDPEPIETMSSSKSLMETEIKCSFCNKTHERQDLVSLEESQENKVLVNMLEQYLLETNLKNTEALLTCATCLGALQGGLSVILKCLEVEEKISKYIELEGTDDKGRIELKKVQQFMFKPILKLEIESPGENELEARCGQIKEEYTLTAETEIKCEKEISNPELLIKTEDDDIKYEQNDCNITDIKSEQSECDGFQGTFTENKIPNDPSRMSVVISEMREPEDRIKQLLILRKTFRCEICSYVTKHKYRLEDHLLTHKSPPEIKMYKCAMCSYAAKRKGDLKIHLLTHKSPSQMKMFKCETCPFEAKRKQYLEQHLLTHKSIFEIKMFKCERCLYETKRRGDLNVHLLTHKNPSEVKMFKCKLCPYETKLKSAVNRHLLTHRGPAQIKMIKCEMCPYEAKRKQYLDRHLLTHKSISEITMFKCDMCPFEAKRKSDLIQHLLTHKSPSEIKMFKCKFCSYEAKRKFNLGRHVLTHKSPSEIMMFKCELCSYEAKRKSDFKYHILTHKSPSQIKMFKCETCPFEAKRKQYLKRHVLTHKSPPEIKMFKCEMCLFETKRKPALKHHLSTHK